MKVEVHYCPKPRPIQNRHWALDKWDVHCAFTWDCLFFFLHASCSCFDYQCRVDCQQRCLTLLLLYLFRVVGEADFQRFQIYLVLSAQRMPVPKVCGTNIGWIVSYTSELWKYLAFFVGSNRKMVFCVYLNLSFNRAARVPVNHSVFDWQK